MSEISNLAKDLARIISESQKRKTSGYDAQAEVLRVEGSTAWVHIPGGVEETPIQLTQSAKKGDIVRVRVSGGGAWITGNDTSPPTDNTYAYTVNERAGAAMTQAIRAQDVADAAEEEAERAHEAADQAEAEAIRAYNEAESAHRSAIAADEEAQAASASASRANIHANNALTQLGVVEQVVNTLEWITEHGTYQHTSDTEIIENKVYYVEDGGVYVPVEEPVVEDLDEYYELVIDEAVSNYVASHLALTDDGLWVVKDNEGYKIKAANDGIYVYDPAGHLVATFGENIILNSMRGQYIGNDEVFIAYYDADEDGVPDSLVINGASITMESGVKLSDYIGQVWHNITFDIIENYNPPNVSYSAKVYRFGEEIHENYPAGLFSWFIKDEDGYTYMGTGYTYSTTTDAIKYAGSVKCIFSVDEDMPFEIYPGYRLIMPDGKALAMRYFN